MWCDKDLREKKSSAGAVRMRPVFWGHPHGVLIRISSASQASKLVSTTLESKQIRGFSSVRMRCVRESGRLHPLIRNPLRGCGC
jgi:hypothetical protein